MNAVTCCATLLAGATVSSGAIQPWQGLDVTVENLSPALHVNGVGIATTRVTGPGVPQFVSRLEQQWRAEPGSVTAMWKVVGPWRVLARAIGPVSQVLQVRDRRVQSEALLSALDIRRKPVAPPRSALRLPSTCHIVNTVHSGEDRDQNMQQLASCPGSAASVLQLLRNQASISGFRLPMQSAGNLLYLQRHDVQVSIAVNHEPGTNGTGSAVVVVQQREGERK